MRLARLHLVTNDEVVTESGFEERALELVETYGPAVALHLRAPATRVGRLHELAAALTGPAAKAGSLLVVNDRSDVALAADCGGVQLGSRSIPVQAARRLLGAERRVGYSAHGWEEAASAVENGADYVVLGTIWPTPSHPDEPGAGVERIRETAGRLEVPIVAIGGVTPERARQARAAGAYGVAVVRGVWSTGDPVAAVAAYLGELEA